MQALTLVLFLLAAVLISAVVDQLLPKVSLPLVQIGLGVLISLFASSQIKISLDPELFLVVFIAPLLYEEAKNTDKTALWRHIKPVLSLAIGLVILTTVVIGFSVHAVIPSIGLAAAFALGAALGPTDAVAVTSLSKQVDIPERQKSILNGELLLNDASGIVSFQFAIAVAAGGTFSLIEAGTDFFIEFFGGIIAGAILGYLGRLIVRKVRDLGIENTTFHVLFEIFVPFLVYLISNSIHVSGIIAVVIAGLINVINVREIGPSISRMNIVSSSVWRVFSFALNGIVFVLLGTQLPLVMMDSWDDVSIDNVVLVGYVIGLTVLLLGIRFLWVLAMDYVHWRSGDKASPFKSEIRNSLITTLSGAKGTITLSILLTLPYYIDGSPFPQRDLIIFLACGVILCTLLVATFVVPLIAPKKEQESNEAMREREAELHVEILRNVIEELTARQTRETRVATQSVVRSYNDRISRIKDSHDLDDEPSTPLRLKAIRWESDYVKLLAQSDEFDNEAALKYLKRLRNMADLISHSSGPYSIQHLYLRVRATLRRVKSVFLRRVAPMLDAAEEAAEVRKIQRKSCEHVIGRLEEMLADPNCDQPTEIVSEVLVEYQRMLTALANGGGAPSVTTITRAVDKADDIKRLACNLELEQIQSFYEDGQLSRASAKRLRDNVQLMLMDVEDKV